MSLSKDMLVKMYDLFSFDYKVTQEKLMKIGFLERDVEELSQKGYLEKDASGVYTLASLEENDAIKEDLLAMGFTVKSAEGAIRKEYLARAGRDVYTLEDAYKLADSCNEHLNGEVTEEEFGELLKKYYYLNPNDVKIARTLLYRKIERGEFDDELYEYIEVTDVDEKDKINNNLLLFLIQYVTTLPRKYGLRVIHLDASDLMISDEMESRYLKNGLRGILFHEDFEEVFYRPWEEKLDPFQKIVRSLLRRINEDMVRSKNNICDMVVLEHDYMKAYKSLLKEKQKRQLFVFERTVMKMAEDIIRLDNGYKINQHEIYDPTFAPESRYRYYNPNFSKAVFAGNYEIAYKILSMSHIVSGDNAKIFNTLLEMIAKRNPDIFYRIVISDLRDDNFVNALEDVQKYLSIINASEYANYVNNLIRLAVVNKDKTFATPANVLSRLRNGERAFDPTSYIPDFSVAISEGDVTKASIYKDIILESRKIGGPDINPYFFNKTLEEVCEKEEKSKASNTFTVEEEASVDKDLVLLSLSDIISDVKESKGLRILERLDEDTQNEVMEVLEKVPNIKPLIVGDRVALRYVDLEENKGGLFYNKLIGHAFGAFGCKYYDDAIELFSNICAKMGTPNPIFYSKIGLSYMRRGSSKDDYDRALDYFYVAQAGGQYVEPYIKMTKEKTNYAGTKVTQYVKK